MLGRVEYRGRCLGREAAERATKSREVDLSRLKGFPFVFRAKNLEWRDRQLVRWHLEVEWMAEIYIGSIPTETIVCVCVSPASKEQIKFVYSVLKWLRAKILNENWRYPADKKHQSLFKSWIDHLKGDTYPVVHFWQTCCTEILKTKTKP